MEGILKQIKDIREKRMHLNKVCFSLKNKDHSGCCIKNDAKSLGL